MTGTTVGILLAVVVIVVIVGIIVAKSHQNDCKAQADAAQSQLSQATTSDELRQASAALDAAANCYRGK